MKYRLILSAAAFLATAASFYSNGQDETIRPAPAATYEFAVKDGQHLYLDDYRPSGPVDTGAGRLPSIIFVFGGGFKAGSRDNESYKDWFGMLLDKGYRLFSIDYRLGLKNSTKAGLRQVKEIHNAVQMAVEDLFSATAYLIAHADELEIDPGNLVISGSSAGAITVLQADWELSNRAPSSSVLPGDFHYAGVMSFAGAILSDKGMIGYPEDPSPTLLMHGTSDKVVNYGQIRVPFYKYAFFGSSKLARIFAKREANYNIIRYKGHGHDIAGSMDKTFPEQLRFLETNVIGDTKRIVDATLDDPSVPVVNGARNRKELYSGK